MTYKGQALTKLVGSKEDFDSELIALQEQYSSVWESDLVLARHWILLDKQVNEMSNELFTESWTNGCNFITRVFRGDNFHLDLRPDEYFNHFPIFQVCCNPATHNPATLGRFATIL